jgi:hypothetical protein
VVQVHPGPPFPCFRPFEDHVKGLSVGGINTYRVGNADETLSPCTKDFGRERPSEHVWAAKPQNTRVAPAQIDVFVCGLSSELISAVCSSQEPCGGAKVNGAPRFRGEHCVCSCVHPIGHCGQALLDIKSEAGGCSRLEG